MLWFTSWDTVDPSVFQIPVQIPKLNPCHECERDILEILLQAFTILSFGYIRHRICIQKYIRSAFASTSSNNNLLNKAQAQKTKKSTNHDRSPANEENILELSTLLDKKSCRLYQKQIGRKTRTKQTKSTFGVYVMIEYLLTLQGYYRPSIPVLLRMTSQY
ncbi:4595_t:CDS:2 [Ambispora gerdemannii]|uniref:4595_t:CDS:1 n=1 Tax=Ambispora gerdemannii TaxID=144530 RepID=A0A9N9CSR8_9GLOM|nr:4595_t:CDS:2 [Ambispora gerdemannii]